MTQAVAGVGTQLLVGDGGSPVEVFAAIAEVLTLTGPELAAEEIEVTNLDSAGGFKEFITGLVEGGTISLDLNWIKGANQVTLRDDVAAGTQRNYRITFSDSPATVANFAGVVTAFSFSTEPNSQIQSSATVRITGVIAWT